MMKEIILLLILFLMASTVSATIMVTDVNVSKLDGGAGFIGPADVNINFKVLDTNTALFLTTQYLVDISYSTTKGVETTSIVNDLNIGTSTILGNTGYCDKNVSLTTTTCHYKWATASIAAITDGNYYIDVNVIARWKTDEIADFNMDTNNSFYIDNTSPECKMDAGRGNDFTWEISGEDLATAAGSQTIIYAATSGVNVGTPSFSATTLGAMNFLAGTFSNGTKKYSCYATDTAGHTSSIEEKTITYPSAGGSVVVSGGGATAQSVAAMQSIFTDVAANPFEFAKANPLLVGIVLIAGYVIWKGQSKKGKSKKRK